MTARHLIVSGRVQGVFFRAWTRQEADALGVTGWVRNCPDGSVEAHVEGEGSAVRALIERMQVGPPGARVTDIDIRDCETSGGTGFEIRH